MANQRRDITVPQPNKTPILQTTIRLDPELHDRARACAFYNRTTISRIFVDALRRELDRLEKNPVPNARRLPVPEGEHTAKN